MVAHNALRDVGFAIRELRLADGYAARTGDETRFDIAFADLLRHEERAKLILAKHASAIEARSDATPQSGAAEGKSATAESGDAHPQSGSPPQRSADK